MQGRWTIFPCPACGLATGRHKGCDVERPATPVVPCDDAAVERVARALMRSQGHPTGPLVADLNAAKFLLRAAGETP